MDLESSKTIKEYLHQANRVVITSHIRPDGDAVGAVLGLGTALQEAGKQVQVVLADGIPAVFRHFPGSKLVSRKVQGDYDLAVVLDCSDLQRSGGVLGDRKPEINIDHHVTNLEFGIVNLVEPEAAATCEILGEFLPRWGFTISQPAAALLLAGIVTDTIGFRTSNTRPHTLRCAADLMELGASLSEVYYHNLLRQSYEAAGLWGKGLTRLQRQDRLVYTSLSLEDKQQIGYNGNDDADLINLLSTIDDADIAIIFVELNGGIIKVSWRAQPGFDVSRIAVKFGGGGHLAAAGAQIPGTLEEVTRIVLETTAGMASEGLLNNEPDHE
ncbi:MAG: bifunctional oligoribonuclease/PAP phosphatase NrnA [bacterium]